MSCKLVLLIIPATPSINTLLLHFTFDAQGNCALGVKENRGTGERGPAFMCVRVCVCHMWWYVCAWCVLCVCIFVCVLCACMVMRVCVCVTTHARKRAHTHKRARKTRQCSVCLFVCVCCVCRLPVCMCACAYVCV